MKSMTTHAVIAWTVKRRMAKLSGLPKMVPRQMILRLTYDELACIFGLLFYLVYTNNLFTVLLLFSYFFQGLFSTFIKTVGRKVSLSITHCKQVNQFVNASKFR